LLNQVLTKCVLRLRNGLSIFEENYHLIVILFGLFPRSENKKDPL